MSHRKLQENLEILLMEEEPWVHIETNIEYGRNGHVAGEIDLLKYDEEVLTYYEVKCNPLHYDKAVDQLYRALEHYTPHWRDIHMDKTVYSVRLMFVTKTGDKDWNPSLRLVDWVRV